ncbi:14101_t:CDS:2, partial [Funneliformis caledonium]
MTITTVVNFTIHSLTTTTCFKYTILNIKSTMKRQQNTMEQFDFATASPQESELKQLKVASTWIKVSTYSAIESTDSVAFKRRHGRHILQCESSDSVSFKRRRTLQSNQAIR